jgi:hypothetical protein
LTKWLLVKFSINFWVFNKGIFDKMINPHLHHFVKKVILNKSIISFINLMSYLVICRFINLTAYFILATLFTYTVKPVYNGHSWELKKVAVWKRWLIKLRFRLVDNEINWPLLTGGHCLQVVVKSGLTVIVIGMALFKF